MVAKEAKATMPPEASTTAPRLGPSLWAFVPAPRLRRVTIPDAVEATNTSRIPLESSGTRFDASEENTTRAPSADITGAKLSPSPSTPPGPTDSRVVVPWSRRRTNTSSSPLASPGTRLSAKEAKATTPPSALIDGL